MAKATGKKKARKKATSSGARAAGSKGTSRAAKASKRPRRSSSSGSRRAKREEEPEAPARPLPRSFWSGTLSFGLVSLPVELYPATRTSGPRTRLLAPDGVPLQQRWVCPEEDRELRADEIVRADEVEGHGFITLSEAEIEGLEPRRTRDIELSAFVERDALEPILFERSWVLTPRSPQTKPYRLLAAVLEETGRAGIARFVLRRRERLVAITAEGGVLWGHSLRFAEEVRGIDALDFEPPKASPTAVRAFTSAIRALAADAVEPTLLADLDRAALEELVERKRARGEDLLDAPETAPEDAPRAAEEADTAEPEEPGSPPDLFEEIRRRMRGERAPSTRKARRR